MKYHRNSLIRTARRNTLGRILWRSVVNICKAACVIISAIGVALCLGAM